MTNKPTNPYQAAKAELNPNWQKEGPVTSLIRGITNAAQRGAQLPGGSWSSVAIAPSVDYSDHSESDPSPTKVKPAVAQPVSNPTQRYAWNKKNKSLTMVDTASNKTTVYLLNNNTWFYKINNMRITDPNLIATLNAEHKKLTKNLLPETAMSNKLFTDAKYFNTQWQEFVESNSQDTFYTLPYKSDLYIVLEDIWKNNDLSVLSESVRQVRETEYLIENIIRREPIYETFYSTAQYIAEAQLTQAQIKDLFKKVDELVRSGGSNRTLVGKGADAVKKAATAFDKLKEKIASSGPVSGFDTLIDQLQQKTVKALGGEGGKVSQGLLKYRQFAKAHPIMQGAVYALFVAAAAVATAASGPAAIGLIAGGIKLFDRMLQGDKSSSAIWKAFKTAAIAAGGAAAAQYISGSGAPIVDTTPPTPGPGGPELSPQDMRNAFGSQVYDRGFKYVAKAGDTLSQIAQANNVSVQDLLQANPNISDPNILSVGQNLNIPAGTGNAVYQGGAGTFADTYNKIAQGAMQMPPTGDPSLKAQALKMGLPWPPKVGALKEHHSRYGYNRYIDYKKTAGAYMLAESKGSAFAGYYITEEARKILFRNVVSEGIWDAVKKGWDAATNKVTADKLDMNWRRNYGDNPAMADGVDCQVVIDFLRKQKVSDEVINQALDSMGLSADCGGGATAPAGDAATPTTAPAGDAATPTTAPAGDAASAPASTAQVTKVINPFSNVKELRKQYNIFLKTGKNLSPAVVKFLTSILSTATTGSAASATGIGAGGSASVDNNINIGNNPDANTSPILSARGIPITRNKEGEPIVRETRKGFNPEKYIAEQSEYLKFRKNLEKTVKKI